MARTEKEISMKKYIQCQKYNFCCYHQMTQQANWLPDMISQADGMEMEKLTILGPILGLSVFAEDDVSLILLLANCKV